MGNPTRILILGGGYVAITASRVLHHAIKKNPELEVTVVSRDNVHVFHGFVAEMLTGRIQPGQIISPARRIFAPSRLHVGEIEQIDLENRTVTTSRHLDGRQHVLEYDHVVLALGSVDNLSMYPGLAEHGFKLKTYDDCFRLRNHIIDMLELADIEQDPEERRRLLTFVVAGGGYAGVEVASELIDYLHLLCKKEYCNLRKEEIRVALVHHGEHILPELQSVKGAPGHGKGHPRLVEAAEKHLRKLGVDLLTQTRVNAATALKVVLDNGNSINTRTIISAVGTKMPSILDNLKLPRDERGRFLTEETLQVKGYTHIWAAGDCAAVPNPKGGTCPTTGIYALAEGKQLGKNMLRMVNCKPLKPFRYAGLGQGCSIGHRYAIGELRGLEFKGFMAWLIWRAFGYHYVPTKDRQLRLLADWLIWPLVGRDIAEYRVGYGHGIEHVHVEPGEIIVCQGDVGRHVYIVRQGEVEVLQKDESGGENILAVLGPGHHFGSGNLTRSRRLSTTVRAKTSVELITIGYGQAKEFAAAADAENLLIDEN